MLSVLFVTTRMRALSVTDKLGAPPAWVQDGMYVSTWSLQIAGLMCLASGLIMAKVRTDYNGNTINNFSKQTLGTLVIAVRYTAMLMLYCGLTMVAVGLFTLNSNTANGRGSFADVFGDTAGANPVPLSSGPGRLAVSTVHSLVQLGSL